jgi:DNA segregation ATPase FtsK/SpoIIIE-like protein
MIQAKQHKKKLRKAKRVILTAKKRSSRNSISYLQRKMQIGYNSAGKLMDEMSKIKGFEYLVKNKY